MNAVKVLVITICCSFAMMAVAAIALIRAELNRIHAPDAEYRVQIRRWQDIVDRATASGMTFSSFKTAHKSELPFSWSHDHRDHMYMVENSFVFHVNNQSEEVVVVLRVDEHGKVLGGKADRVWHL